MEGVQERISRAAETRLGLPVSWRRLRQLPADVELQLGLDVRQEQHVARARAVRELGLKALEHPQLRVERLARVQVPAVLASPEERPSAGHALDVRDVHAAAAHHLELLLAEVVAHGPDDAHIREEGGGKGEVDGGAAEHPLALPERRLDAVEGDRANHCD